MLVDDSPGTVIVDDSTGTVIVDDDSPGTVMVDDSPGTVVVDDSPGTVMEEEDDDFPEWPYVLEKAMLLCEDGDIPEYQYIPTIRRGENQEPKLTAEQEYESFLKEVKDSEGFDISFHKYRCIFNYQPLDFAIEPETTRELIGKLSKGSLVVYNKEKETNYTFEKVEKANFHSSACGNMYFITFEAKQPSDDKPKLFRAKVHYSHHYPTQYIYCYLKPEEKETEEKDPKKPRLTKEEEPSKYTRGW